MQDLFDEQERATLETALRDTFQSQSGLSPAQFNGALSAILFAVQNVGFHRQKVIRLLHGEDEHDAIERLLPLVWEPIQAKAEMLARASFQGGVSNLCIFLDAAPCGGIHHRFCFGRGRLGPGLRARSRPDGPGREVDEAALCEPQREGRFAGPAL
jgi:hypothetical protein